MALGKVVGPLPSSFKYTDPSQDYDNDTQTSKQEPALRVAVVLLKKLFFIFICVWVFSLHVCLHTTCIQCLWSLEEATESPGTSIAGVCEPLCRG